MEWDKRSKDVSAETERQEKNLTEDEQEQRGKNTETIEAADATEAANAADAVLDELDALLPRLPDPEMLTDAQKDRERKQHRDRLKVLNAVPRSDWHREFEDILQIEIASWHNGSVILRETSIGEDAPRADFILISGARLTGPVKSVFRIFREKNAIEYKRPTESLTEKMIWKTGGYGNLLIGTAQESEYSADELSLSIFAYRKNKKQFASMIGRGILRASEAKGIYHVIGMTPLPYQVVIVEELEGREYAAYRALSKHAEIQDIAVILDSMKESPLNIRDRYFRILQMIELHNAGAVRDMIREDRKMKTIFLDLFEPEIQEREKKAAEAARAEAEEAARAEAEAAIAKAENRTIAQVAERMINMGMDGSGIASVTGYDRSRIDNIARRLNRTVSWN